MARALQSLKHMRTTGYAICLLLTLLLASTPGWARPQLMLQKGRTAGTARLTFKNLQVRGGPFARNLSLTLPAGLAARLSAAASESLTVSALKQGKQTQLRVTAGYGCNAVIIERDKNLRVQLGASNCVSRYKLDTRATKQATAIDPVSLGQLPRGSRKPKKWFATELCHGGICDPHAKLGGGVRAESATLVSSLGRLGGELSNKPFGTWHEQRTTPQVRETHPGIKSAVQTLEQVLHNTYTTRPSPLRLKRGEIAEYSAKTGFGPKGSSITPDPARSWHKVQVENKACTFVTGVKLQLKPGDDLRAVASTLAVGRSVKKVEQALKRHVQAGRTEIPLQELLPTFVQQNHGTYADRSTASRTSTAAPNCFNAALGFHSSRATPRYTSPAQFRSRLKRGYKLLQPGEEIRFGDMVVVWGHSYNHASVRKKGKVDPFGASAEPVHASVYLDKDLLFGKASVSLKTSYQFEPYAGSFAHYLAKSDGKGLVTVHRRVSGGGS